MAYPNTYQSGYQAYVPQQSYAQPQFYPQQQMQPQAQVQPQQQQNQATFTVRPVGSREEAVAAQVDFFSPGMIMPDLGHGMMYFKRFNSSTGASDFIEFAYKAPEVQKEQVQYVTLDEFNSFKNEMTKRFNNNGGYKQNKDGDK